MAPGRARSSRRSSADGPSSAGGSYSPGMMSPVSPPTHWPAAGSGPPGRPGSASDDPASAHACWARRRQQHVRLGRSRRVTAPASPQPAAAEVMISDCPLREGDQQPGVILGTSQKLAIAGILAEVGIRRAEIGTPAVSEGEREAIAAVVDAGRIAETIGVCRARTDDVELAHRCGLWGVVISSPASRYQLE